METYNYQVTTKDTVHFVCIDAENPENALKELEIQGYKASPGVTVTELLYEPIKAEKPKKRRHRETR